MAAIATIADATTASSTDLFEEVYGRLADRVALGRRRLGRPLTLAEKILFNHLADPEGQDLERGRSYAQLFPDRVAMQDATAQMALLQLITAGVDKVAVPTTVHCDHLIQARDGADEDLSAAEKANAEVYDFLQTVSARHGIGFWKPGSGIIHQVVLEQYAFPGGLLIGTDSHTPNAGGLAMIGVGVGGADAVDVMVGEPFGLRWPRAIAVVLTGALQGWTSPKDIILEVARILTVSGGTGAIIEYLGPGAASLSATGKATIANMGAEIGATCSLFGYDDRTSAYLAATGRAAVAELAGSVAADLRADPEVEADPARFFDQVVEIDLSALEPRIVGPHSPDRCRPVSRMGAEAAEEGWPTELSQCLVGSCTNSSYEDIARAAHVARQAAAQGLKTKVPLLVTPGSERVRATIERDGLLGELEAIGATVLANACGPCIGQWKRDDVEDGQTNSILSSYNRNFPRRNDGNRATLSFIASPETVVAYALAGTLAFDPLTDTIDGVRLEAPVGDELPTRGFETSEGGYVSPPADGRQVEVKVRPGSERLQLLEPFPAWDGQDLLELPILLKAKGKCTTDHISAAGPWLSRRGHLEAISANLFLGALNAFTGETGTGRCVVHGATESLPAVARHCREAGVGWVAVGDENYGEGSSREHAAMEPRFMGARAILVRSFARIHETNLKKQGLLPLTFADPATYDLIGEGDLLSVLGLADLAPNRRVSCRITRPDGTTLDFEADHTLAAEHIEWWRAGSALNLIRARSAGGSGGR
ncbi:MAG: aconitate hydratase [Acidimicrobiales bacterium]|nr:MAG: aconitate hydratase [Acidimicrobiales bacterium]